MKKNCKYQFHFSVWSAVTYKKKSQTGLLHPIIYKSTYICAYTLDKTCIKNQIIYSQKKGEILYFILNVKFKVFCVNLRQNIGIYTSSRCSLCISCVICPHPNIRQFSDHGIRPKKYHHEHFGE